MNCGALKWAVVGMLACAVVSCGGSGKVGQSNGIVNGSTGGTTGGTNGSTGSTSGDTSGSTGGANGSTGGTNGSTGGTNGSTGGTNGSTGGTNGSTGGSASQLAFVSPSTSCSQFSSASVAGLVILAGVDRSISFSCPDVAHKCTSYRNLTSIVLTVANYDIHGAVSPVGSGTYPITGGSLAGAGTMVGAHVDKTDANCVTIGSSGLADGSITIDSVSDSAVKGSYDVTVGGTHYSGAIDAIVCPNDAIQGDICSGGADGWRFTGTCQCL